MGENNVVPFEPRPSDESEERLKRLRGRGKTSAGVDEAVSLPADPKERQKILDKKYFEKNKIVLMQSVLPRQLEFEQQFPASGKYSPGDGNFYSQSRDAFGAMTLNKLHTIASDIDDNKWGANRLHAAAFLSALKDRIENCGGTIEQFEDLSGN